MDAPVTYWPDFLMPIEADEAFAVLDAELPWGRHGLPRDEVYFNDTPAPYTYGSPGRERTYLPEEEWHPYVKLIRFMLEMNLGPGSTPMDVCFLNRYVGPRDQLGWHADDSPEMDPRRPIVTVSLGAVRDIMFRATCNCPRSTLGGATETSTHASDCAYKGTERLELGNGSAAIMRPGMQQAWQHRIPKSSKSNIGTRISLTFRGYLSEVDQISRRQAENMFEEIERERLGADYYVRED